MNCKNLKQKYEELLTLQAEFTAANEKFQQMKPNTVAERRAVSDELLVRQKEIEGLIKENFADLLFISVEKARLIMDKNLEAGKTHCLGPAEIERAFGIKMAKEKIPPIPFSKQELERANEMGKFLILRSDVDDLGNPLAMMDIPPMMTRQGYSEQLDKAGNPKGRIMLNEDYRGSDSWWVRDYIELRWALVDNEPIKDSINEDYYQQTVLLMKHLLWIYRDMKMPKKYQEAIAEFVKYGKDNFFSKTDHEINSIIGGRHWEKYARELSKLKLNNLLRKTAAEELYDNLAYFQINGERDTLSNSTKSLNSRDAILSVGGFDRDGVSVNGRSPYEQYDCVFSSCS